MTDVLCENVVKMTYRFNKDDIYYMCLVNDSPFDIVRMISNSLMVFDFIAKNVTLIEWCL